jgi:hypothetical protein
MGECLRVAYAVLLCNSDTSYWNWNAEQTRNLNIVNEIINKCDTLGNDTVDENYIEETPPPPKKNGLNSWHGDCHNTLRHCIMCFSQTVGH